MQICKQLQALCHLQLANKQPAILKPLQLTIFLTYRFCPQLRRTGYGYYTSDITQYKQTKYKCGKLPGILKFLKFWSCYRLVYRQIAHVITCTYTQLYVCLHAGKKAIRYQGFFHIQFISWTQKHAALDTEERIVKVQNT